METLVTPKRPQEGAASEADQVRRPSATSAAHKALIARNLRLAYQEVAKEGVPDRMLDLLDELVAKESKGADE